MNGKSGSKLQASSLANKHFSCQMPCLSKKLLQPCTQYTHDWMHGMCSQGVLCTVASLLLKSLAEDALPNVWHLLHGYLEAWQYPSVQKKSSSPHKLFTQQTIAGHKKAQTFKCSAQ